ncbi:MAG: NADH:flavin oxidoreductase/NADH oxidase [Burkholderiaceae bacterium]
MLLTPFQLRQLVFPNRIVISPMCQYSATEGLANDWHLVHLGQFALGGAGAVIVEATAVQRDGRITLGDLGLWSDEQIAPLRRITAFLQQHGSRAGIQLGHAGRKGSSQRPWHGNGPLTEADLARGERGWPTVSAGDQPVGAAWPPPRPLGIDEIRALIDDWVAATRRAREAGFDFVEIHAAHGYLLHQFLSSLSNSRQDAYGGSLENRMRLTLEVAQAVRQAWPADRPVFVRLSVIDGSEPSGWGLDDSVVLARELRAIGVDAIDCSSSGLGGPATAAGGVRAPGFQVPLAAAIRERARIATMAVGLILDPWQADRIVRDGHADLVAVAREALLDPHWAARAALALDPAERERFAAWPDQYGWWLQRRERMLAAQGLGSASQPRLPSD